MTDHFVKLSCLNCAQQLDVYEDMQQFFCGACGAKMAAERRGGTVVLTSAHKTAAREDVQSLSKQRDEMLAQEALAKKQGFGVGAALLLAGYIIVRLGIAYLFGLGVLLAGIGLIAYVRRKGKSVRMDVRLIQAKIDALTGRA